MINQRRLAKAGRGGDEGEFPSQTLIQPLNQARARNQACPEPCRRIGAGWGDIEFGLQNRYFHNIKSITWLDTKKKLVNTPKVTVIYDQFQLCWLFHQAKDYFGLGC